MARFYGQIQGNRGLASRMGTPNSGFWAHIRGWNIGVEVNLYVDAEGRDVAEVVLTGGSGGAKRLRPLGRFVDGVDNVEAV